MSERMERPQETEVSEREQLKDDIIKLATELVESRETFPFPGITAEARKAIQDDEDAVPNYAEYATLLTLLLPRFEAEGMIFAFGVDPKSGNVFVIPAETGNIRVDNLFPHQLKDSTDERVQRLIQMSTAYKKGA